MVLYAAKIAVYLCGLFNIVFGLFHIINSPFIFDAADKPESANEKSVLIITLNLSVALFLFFLAYLNFSNPIQIITTTLGKNILIFGFIFWIGRLVLLLFWDYQKIGQKLLFIIFLICGVIAHYYPMTLF